MNRYPLPNGSANWQKKNYVSAGQLFTIKSNIEH